MTVTRAISAALLALVVSGPAFAEITIEDPYASSASPMAKTGAAFMKIMNSGEEADRLVSAASDIAQRVELHTHIETGDGVMQMVEVEEGFVIPAGGMHALARGGDHVMFMGLNEPLENGETISGSLTFEKAGPMTVEIPVDLERVPEGGMGHGNMNGMSN